MIEYSIRDLKYYYNKYDNDDMFVNNDINNDNPYKNNEELINRLEDALSDLTDYEYINNNIYHIFPVFIITIAANFLVSSFIALS